MAINLTGRVPQVISAISSRLIYLAVVVLFSLWASLSMASSIALSKKRI